MHSAEEITAALNKIQISTSQADKKILDDAVNLYKHSFDKKFGGFGNAPKFPSPHILLFLMQHYQKHNDFEALNMVEMTLLQMYSGGLFDHIGYGFCRYSTDRYYLVPHFEKMLYDNALLILAYCKAYEITRKPFYREIAEKTAFYILTEMTSNDGSFYSAQDADSDGEEGKYYLLNPDEIVELLGEKDGSAFNEYYGITKEGNFEGKSIPNLLHTKEFTDSFDAFHPQIREYRRLRNRLHIDDKILTSWNALMIIALCALYRTSHKPEYLEAAKRSQQFIDKNLCNQDVLYVSFRDGKHSGKGFLDDYASYASALIALYEATLDMAFLDYADRLVKKAVLDFYDDQRGGFYLYGEDNETLIFCPKECYDGAIPSGNSLMTYNLVRLSALRPSDVGQILIKNQMNFMSGQAEQYPPGYAMFLLALSDFLECNLAGN